MGLLFGISTPEVSIDALILLKHGWSLYKGTVIVRVITSDPNGDIIALILYKNLRTSQSRTYIPRSEWTCGRPFSFPGRVLWSRSCCNSLRDIFILPNELSRLVYLLYARLCSWRGISSPNTIVWKLISSCSYSCIGTLDRRFVTVEIEPAAILLQGVRKVVHSIIVIIRVIKDGWDIAWMGLSYATADRAWAPLLSRLWPPFLWDVWFDSVFDILILFQPILNVGSWVRHVTHLTLQLHLSAYPLDWVLINCCSDLNSIEIILS